MFSRIVVGTDGSPTAEAAVSVAIELARLSAATLYVVNAYRVSGSGPSPVAAPAAAESLSASAAKETADRLLDSVRERAAGVEVVGRPMAGAAADVLVAAAEEVDADLVVVGSKGMQGARRLIGSIPNSVAHNAPCHVLIAKTT